MAGEDGKKDEEKDEKAGASGAPTTSAELAAGTAAETEKALPPPGAGQGSGAVPLDAYGRAFDPALHQTKIGPDGVAVVPVIHRRTGRLMCLPGRGLRAQDRAAAPGGAAATGSSLGPTVEAGAQGAAGDASSSDAAGAGQAQPGAEHVTEAGAVREDPLPTPEEIARRARADAKVIRKGLRWLGRWMAGPEDGEYLKEPDDEGGEVQETAREMMEAHGWRLPLGSVTPFLFAAGEYISRCAGSEKNTRRFQIIIAKLTGKPVRVVDERPAAVNREREATAPAAAPGGAPQQPQQPRKGEPDYQF